MLGIALVAMAWSAHVQHYQVFRLWDSDEYYVLAEQLAAGAPVTASAPYAYRVLTPWIVARCCAANIQRGFLIVNLVAGVLSALTLTYWLRRYVGDWRVRVLLAAAYIWEWHSPVRFPFYYPAYVDPLLLAFLPLGLECVERVAERPGPVNAGLLVAVTGLGVVAREMMMLVPLCAFFHRRLTSRGPARWTRIAALAALFALAGGAYLATQRGTMPRVSYSFLEAVGYHLRHKPIFSLALTWFMTFGPIVALALYDWRESGRLLVGERHLGAYLLACALFAYVGGHDTERYLIWAAPVVYVLIGRAIIRHRRALSSTGLIAALAVAQLVSARVFWGIPDPTETVTALSDVPGLPSKIESMLNRLFVVDSFHWNLWSNFGSRPFHLLLLALYAAFSALVIVWMRSRSVSDPWTSKHVEI